MLSDAESYLPLSEATFFILLSLAAEAKHGYAIMKEVQALSENRVVLSTSTLYGALKRMLEQSWVKRVADPANAHSGRERKAYTLTHIGRRILSAEITRLQKLVATARRTVVKPL